MSSFADKYEMVVGLEVHVQLKTQSKAFCGCSTNFGAPPNTNTCPVCLGLPGALPVLNREAVQLAMRASLALQCTVNHTSIFARKNYFYPDLPKGYQISQFDRPLAEHGAVDITLPDGVAKRIGVTRLHMEEDAGKSIHDRFPGFSAIDLNRAGVPLAEIVSEPDMRSAAEAGAYLRAIKQILEYAGVSDVSMEEGSLRVDANVSARLHGAPKFGTKTEVKNMNSFSGVERALQVEWERQCLALERNETIHQQTMLWDGGKGEVRPARSKEESHDYRYFPEPDLPPLIVTDAEIKAVRDTMPELPQALKTRLATTYGIGTDVVEVLAATPSLVRYYEAAATAHGDGKNVANWVLGEVSAMVNASPYTFETFPVAAESLAKLLDLVRDGAVSHTAGKTILGKMLETGKAPQVIAEEEGLTQVGDDSALVQWIDEVFAELPAESERFRAGERKLTGVLVGAVMKKSKGRADPKKVNRLLGERVG